jgi:hypothetical protein
MFKFSMVITYNIHYEHCKAMITSTVQAIKGISNPTAREKSKYTIFVKILKSDYKLC